MMEKTRDGQTRLVHSVQCLGGRCTFYFLLLTTPRSPQYKDFPITYTKPINKLTTMSRGNQREKAREKNNAKAAGTVC
jgi:4F5 protein related disordered region